MPAAICRDQRVGGFRAPGPALVGQGRMMVAEHGLDHRPGGFDSILAREQRVITGHRIAEQALVGLFVEVLGFVQAQLAQGADEALPGLFHARRQRDRR